MYVKYVSNDTITNTLVALMFSARKIYHFLLKSSGCILISKVQVCQKVLNIEAFLNRLNGTPRIGW